MHLGDTIPTQDEVSRRTMDPLNGTSLLVAHQHLKILNKFLPTDKLVADSLKDLKVEPETTDATSVHKQILPDATTTANKTHAPATPVISKASLPTSLGKKINTTMIPISNKRLPMTIVTNATVITTKPTLINKVTCTSLKTMTTSIRLSSTTKINIMNMIKRKTSTTDNQIPTNNLQKNFHARSH